MTKNELKSTTHGGGRVLSVILAGTLAMGMTPAVSLTAQSLEPVQAYAAATELNEGMITVGSLTYTGSELNPQITVTVDDKPVESGESTYSVNGYYSDQACTQVATVKDATTYYVKVTPVAGDTFSDANPVVKSFTVEKATITVAENSAVTPTNPTAISNNFEGQALVASGLTVSVAQGTVAPTLANNGYSINITSLGTVEGTTQSVIYTLTPGSNYKFADGVSWTDQTMNITIDDSAKPVDDTVLTGKMIVQPALTAANYNGTDQTPGALVSATINGSSVNIPLAADNQGNGYTLSWVNAEGDPCTDNLTAPGSYYAQISLGDGYELNDVTYTGTATATTPFVISKCPVDTLFYTYDGQPIVGNNIPVDSVAGVDVTKIAAYFSKAAFDASATAITATGAYTSAAASDGKSVTITAAADGNFSGTKTFTVATSYAISKANIYVTADGKVPTANSPKLVYSAASVNPKVVVTNPDTSKGAKKLLEEGVDYTLQFVDAEGNEIDASAIVDVAEYAVQVTAVEGSAYTTAGQATVNGQTVAVDYVTHDFKVEPYVLTKKNTTVSGLDNLVYTGKSIAQPKSLAITANINGKSVPLTIAGADGVGDVTVDWTQVGTNATTPKTPYQMGVKAVANGNFATTEDAALSYDVFVAPAPIAAGDVTVDYKGTKENPKTELLLTDSVNQFDLANNVVVKVAGKTLATPADYTLSIPGLANTIVKTYGDYPVTVKGTGNYTGTQVATVAVRQDIKMAQEDGFKWTNPDEDPEWTGEAIEKPFTLSYNGRTLQEGTDYTVEWKNNVNAGKNTASVVITGTGNVWGGSFTENFTIKGEEAVIDSVKVEKATYNGNEQTPVVSIVLKDAAGKVIPGVNPVIIPVGTDKYINANTYAIKVAVEGKYMVEPATADFIIEPAKLADLTVTPVYPAGSNAYLLNAKTTEIEPTFAVQLGGNTVTLTNKDVAIDTHGTINTPGTFPVTLTGAGNYIGTTNVVIDVLNDINSLYVAPIADVTYNGKEQTPDFKVLVSEPANETDNPAEVAPSVTAADGKVTENYTVSWKDNTNAGTAQLVLTGKGIYGGTKTVNFTINKADATLEVADVADAIYTGSAIKPEPVATLNSAAGDLASADFTASYAYKNNVNAGEATVTVVASGAAVNNYNVAAATKTFKINAADIKNAAYVGDTTVEVGKQPKVALTFNGKTLVEGTDFTVTGTPNVSKEGKATLTVTGKGNFQGTKTIEITVGKTPVTPDKPTSTKGWKQNATGWWYDNGDNSYPTSTWKKINGNWYYFNKSGYALTGWQKINGTWYYLNKKGEGTECAMVSNCWKKINGAWYSFDKNGAMRTGWYKENGIWYYLNKAGEGTEGKMVANQWKQINGSWFFFHSGGAMATSQYVGPYWVDANGYWVR